MDDHQIIFAINKFKSKAPIVRQVGAYIVFAQDEADFRNKQRKIHVTGDRDGFMTVDEAYEKALKME